MVVVAAKLIAVGMQVIIQVAGMID